MTNHHRLSRTLGPGLLAVVLAMPLAGCGAGDDDLPVPDGRYFSGGRLLGQGVTQPFGDVNSSGNPTAFGMRMTVRALEGLPASPTEFAVHPPPQALPTGFTDIGMTHRPAGTPGPGGITQEHFSVVAFLLTEQERSQITAVGADRDRAIQQPSADALPAGFVQVASDDPFFAQPGFGTRFFHPSPPVPLSPFTRRLFLGYYNGQLAFIEMVIARALFDGKVEFTDPIPLPAAVPKPGLYPTEFSLDYNSAAQDFAMIFGNLVQR